MKAANDIVADRFMAAAYTDALGRRWSITVLNRLLTDRRTRNRVMLLYASSLKVAGAWGGDFRAGAMWSTLKRGGRRDEVVALYLLLVARYRDTLQADGGAP